MLGAGTTIQASARVEMGLLAMSELVYINLFILGSTAEDIF